MDYRERWEHKDYLIERTLERRILLLQVGIVMVLLAFTLNFWYLQGVRGEQYARLAENNRLRRIPALPTRGVVYDVDRTVIAATRPSLNLVLLREGGVDLNLQLERLAPVLGTTHEALVERHESIKNRPAYQPLVLVEDVSLDQLARIEARRELFPSVEVQQTARRSYPHGDLFSHVLGYVGEVSEGDLERSEELRVGDIVGKSGIELAMDDRLRGLRGWNLVSVNNLGRRIGDAWVGREPRHGEELHLTLDVDLQRALREGLGEEVGAGTFIDSWTGEVLALVSTPTFEPSLFADGITPATWRRIASDPGRPLHDRAITAYYAPGSTFKVIMAMAGLETGAVTPEETVYCPGAAKFYGAQRLCWKRGGHGHVNLRQALAHSCNIYFYNLGQKLGIDTIQSYSEAFGLGHPTGIDIPGEAPGIPPSRAWKRENRGERWYPGDTISVAIGQGLLAVTPVQMATAIAGVATRGRVPTPHVIRDGEPQAHQVELRPDTFTLIQAALADAVKDGTGSEAAVEGVSVAGKTGTAQVYRHSAGVDSNELPKQERDHGWFVGYAPADRPRIAFAVVVEHGGHGGSSAAPIVRKVLEVFFRKLDERSGREQVAEETHARSATAG